MVSFVFSSISLKGQSFIAGHRGASYLAPENTKASLELAWELGAVSTECDILMTSDKQIIVFHDKNGKRLLGKDIDIEKVAYQDIKETPILLPKKTNDKKYEGQTIPLLADILPLIPAKKELIIEIKTGPEIIPYLADVVKRFHKQGRIAMIAFDIETILLAKKTFPDVPCYFLAANREDLNKSLHRVIKHKLEGVDLNQQIIDQPLVEDLNKQGLDVWCWTVNLPQRAKSLINMGVSCITTDRPAWLAKQLNQ